MSRLPDRLRTLWKPSVEQEVDDELAFHVEMRARELVERGLSPDDARAEAVRRFGDLARVSATCRDIGERRDGEAARAELLHAVRHDARTALRQLRRAPAFALVAVLTLALGIGGTTAIFSAVHAVVLRPLPFRAPDGLVRVYATSPTTTSSDELSPKTFAALRREARAVERMAALETRGVALADGVRAPEQVTAVRASAEYFPLLGVPPLLGRVFTGEEDRPGRDRVAVLSHALWERRFAADPAVVGRGVRIDGLPVTVVGVMPPTFDVSAAGVELWMPIAFTTEAETSDETGYLDVVGRLRPNATVASAQAELTALVRRAAELPAHRERGARVVALHEDLVGAFRTRLLVLLGAVGLVLLIACVNVANLLLARGVARSGEMALRAALGAGRARLVRQLLVESTVLGLIGGAAGIALAAWILHALKLASPVEVPRLATAHLDASVLAFALVVTIASSLSFGLIPARRAARPQLQSTLRDGARGTPASATDGIRQALIVVEVALSLVLLVGAGLLIRSAVATEAVRPGLDPRNVWSARVTLPASAYPTPDRLAGAYERILASARELPAVESAAAISVVPFAGVRALGVFVPEGTARDDADDAQLANLRLVSPGAFATLRIPVREGRDFSEHDGVGAPRVVVVNEAFARRAWPGRSAIGQRLAGGGRGATPLEVIGVVGATHEDGLREDRRPAVYVPIRQASPRLWHSVQGSLFVVARTRGEPLAVTSALTSAVQAVDPNVPLDDVRSIEQRLAGSLATARFNTRLLTLLGAVGLLLSIFGIYGVVAYVVGERTREIGVRMALGASPRTVAGMVVRQGMRPVLGGIAVGATVALAVTRVLRSQLHGVSSTDVPTFAAVVAVVALAAAAAAWVPARRAAAIDPKRAIGG